MTLDFSCPVAAWNHVTVPFAGFDDWRKQVVAQRQSASLAQTSKLGDQQTMASAEAMFRAIDAAGWQGRSFENWGIVSAPQFLGRMTVAAAVERYRAQEVRGTSPRHIPTLSQHAVAGTLSVIFQCRGPCFGAGGSQGSVRDALVTAASLVSSGLAAGVWVTFSQWSPEPLPQRSEEENMGAECHAVALAVVPEDSAESQFGLGIRFRPTLCDREALPTVREVGSFLESSATSASWGRSLGPGLWLELRRCSGAVVTSEPRVA